MKVDVGVVGSEAEIFRVVVNGLVVLLEIVVVNESAIIEGDGVVRFEPNSLGEVGNPVLTSFENYSGQPLLARMFVFRRRNEGTNDPSLTSAVQHFEHRSTVGPVMFS
jgi:hypothetical protein